MQHDIKIKKPNKNGQAYQIWVDGKYYPSLNSLEIGSPETIRLLEKSMGCSKEVAIDTLLCKKEEKMEREKQERNMEVMRKLKSNSLKRKQFNDNYPYHVIHFLLDDVDCYVYASPFSSLARNSVAHLIVRGESNLGCNDNRILFTHKFSINRNGLLNSLDSSISYEFEESNKRRYSIYQILKENAKDIVFNIENGIHIPFAKKKTDKRNNFGKCDTKVSLFTLSQYLNVLSDCNVCIKYITSGAYYTFDYDGERVMEDVWYAHKRTIIDNVFHSSLEDVSWVKKFFDWNVSLVVPFEETHGVEIWLQNPSSQ